MSSVGAAAGVWVPLASLQEPRQEVAVAALAGKVYVIGGIRADGSTADTVEVYDPATDRWQFAAPLPTSVHHTAAAVVGGTLYVIGGLWGLRFAPVNAVFAYDSTTNTWTRKASLLTSRGALAVGVVAGRIYAAGGSPRARERDFAVYDPATDTWTSLPPLPTPRNHLAAGTVGTTFYAVGGRSGGIGGITDVLEAFDTRSSAWMTKAPMPTARGGIAGAVVQGCLYVFGGEGNPARADGVFATTEVYDPRISAWQRLQPMRTPRHGIGAAAVGRRIYIPGGATVQGFGVTGVHEAFITELSCGD
jgi:N-acetylneuraminic acid mutarotase